MKATQMNPLALVGLGGGDDAAISHGWNRPARRLALTPTTEERGSCHTCFSKENQVQTYMHARIEFHAYSDI
jgi:hypothetical protein